LPIAARGKNVTDRLTRVLLAGVLVLLAAIFAQPYINESLF